MVRRPYSDADVEAAIEAISDPARLEEAQRMVGANAPGIQRILWERFFKDAEEGVLFMSISAAPPGDNVQFFSNYKHGAAGWVRVHASEPPGRWLRRNATHLIEIIIPRVPADRVFTLRAYKP